jgi:hypothetical protein
MKRKVIMQAIKGIIATSALMFALMLVPYSATADPQPPLTIGEPWGEFQSNDVGQFAIPCSGECPFSFPALNSFFLADLPWTFSGPGFLILQDAFAPIDQFEVFDNNVSLGLTSTPLGTDAVTCGSNPVDCFSFPGSSRGIFALGAGDHSFTILHIAGARGPAYLCIDSGQGECGVDINGGVPVSEPSSLLLLGFALIGAWCWSRREQIGKCYVVLSRKRRRR